MFHSEWMLLDCRSILALTVVFVSLKGPRAMPSRAGRIRNPVADGTTGSYHDKSRSRTETVGFRLLEVATRNRPRGRTCSLTEVDNTSHGSPFVELRSMARWLPLHCKSHAAMRTFLCLTSKLKKQMSLVFIKLSIVRWTDATLGS